MQEKEGISVSTGNVVQAFADMSKEEYGDVYGFAKLAEKIPLSLYFDWVWDALKGNEKLIIQSKLDLDDSYFNSTVHQYVEFTVAHDNLIGFLHQIKEVLEGGDSGE